MKSLFAMFIFFLSFSSLASAPNFKVDDENDLASLKGRVVYVDFWASWCKPCRASFPWMNAMKQKYHEQGLTVLAINLDEDFNSAQAFLKRMPASFDVIYDPQGKIAQQYELVGMPSSFIIDKSGELRISHQGFFINKTDAYESEIVTLLTE